MKIFFHHPADVQFHFSHCNNGTFPGHLLYGAPHFASHGIDMVLRKHRAYVSGAMKAIDGARQILLCRERYDAVFATFHSGLAIVVMLRALHLFSKPVVVWHHQPVIRSPKWWREMLGRLYYRGMDGIIFFSEKLRDESIKTGKVRPEQTYVCHWGADIEYYDRVIAGNTPPMALTHHRSSLPVRNCATCAHWWQPSTAPDNTLTSTSTTTPATKTTTGCSAA